MELGYEIRMRVAFATMGGMTGTMAILALPLGWLWLAALCAIICGACMWLATSIRYWA
jgi:hypothetical protein